MLDCVASQGVSVEHASLGRDAAVQRITVNGAPFDVHLTVDNAGRVHYHGLPTRDFPSVIGLVEKAIDVFPDDFTTQPGGPGEPGQETPGTGHQHGGGH